MILFEKAAGREGGRLLNHPTWVRSQASFILKVWLVISDLLVPARLWRRCDNCSCSCRHTSDHNIPVKLQKNECYFPFCNLSSLYIYIYIYVKRVIQCGRPGFDPWIGKIAWRRAWQPTPLFLPAESPWTEEPSRLQSIGSQKVRHD